MDDIVVDLLLYVILVDKFLLHEEYVCTADLALPQMEVKTFLECLAAEYFVFRVLDVDHDWMFQGVHSFVCTAACSKVTPVEPHLSQSLLEYILHSDQFRLVTRRLPDCTASGNRCSSSRSSLRRLGISLAAFSPSNKVECNSG